MERANIPAKFIEIEGARHGSMGNDPERMMRAALDCVAEPDRPDG